MKICPICNREFDSIATCPDDGATLISKATLDDALIGQVLKDAYRIEEQIGTGGMGAVYRVTQIRLGRSVAVKVLLPKFHSTTEMVKRFYLEARTLSQLNHPNIVSVIDFGNTEDGLIYMVMEYLEGQTLQDYIQGQKGLPKKEIMAFMDQICQGLTAAHGLPLIHRDLKPANIFIAKVTGKGHVVKVLDFGIGKILGDNDEKLTQTGMVMGTPGYLAPEQISGLADPCIASDIYALGGILYFMLGGIAPFGKFTGRSALSLQMNSDPEPIPAERLSEPDMENLFPVVLKAMDRDPKARYQSAGEFFLDLRSRVSGEFLSQDPLAHLSQGERQEAPTVPISRVEHPPTLTEITTEKPSLANPKPASKRKWGALMGLGAVAAVILWLFLGFKPERDPLIFGMSADFTGSNRELGREMQLGIETCFQEINEQGGVADRMLKLVALDDGYEPEPAKANMTELIEQRRVFAIIGNVGTPTAKVAIPVALENKILFFGAFSGAAILRNNPPDRYVFNYRASYAEEAAAIVRYFVEIKDLPPESIAVFSQDDSFGDDGFQGVVRTLRTYDIKEQDILHVRYQRNHFQIEEAVARVLEAPERARAVVTVGTYKQTARFIGQVRQQNPDTLFSSVSFVGARALAEEFLETNPKWADGVIVTQVVPFYDANATGVIRYREALSNYFPNEQPSFVSLEGYIAAKILVEGLKRTKTLNTENLIDTLETMDDLDFGTGSTFSFSPSDHQASNNVWAVVLDEQAAFHELSLE